MDELRIIGGVEMDNDRRITITKLFGSKPYPKKISLTINLELEMLEVRFDTDDGIICTVDEKGRITLPSWICEEYKLTYGEIRHFRLIKYNGRKFISPRTGAVL